MRKLSLREKEKSIADCKELGFKIKRKSLEGTFVIGDQSGFEAANKPPVKNHKKNCKVFMNSIKNFKQALENVDLKAPEDEIPTRRQRWFEPVKAPETVSNEEEALNPLDKTFNLLGDLRILDGEEYLENQKKANTGDNHKNGEYYSKDFLLSESKVALEEKELKSKSSKIKDQDLVKGERKACLKSCVGCNIF